MTPLKKARRHQELDALAFNVLAGFRQQGAIAWTDWHQATSTKRGGKRGLSTHTFNEAVKRLVANGRVRKDKHGCYEGVYSAVENAESGAEGTLVAANSRDVETNQCWEAPLKARKSPRYVPRTSA